MRRFLSVKTPTKLAPALAIIYVFLKTSTVLATEELPFSDMADWGPTTFMMGGASAASSSDHDAFLNNPAGLMYYERRYSIGGHYLETAREQTSYSASTIDGNKGVLSGFHFGSVSYGRPKRQSYTLAVAYKTPYGALGVSTSALRFTGVSPGKGWHFSGTMGVLIPVAYQISIGGSVKSVLDREKNTQLPPQVKMGIMYSNPNQIRVAFDADRRFNIHNQDWNYSLGGDYLMKNYFAVRGGYHWNHSTDYSFYSAGGGIVSPKFEIYGMYMRTTSGPDSNGYGVNAQLLF
ncbi:MAG: hypothetical protein J0L93_06685 [Deltaproteobacteria bacterium]|nr:hypothetical protein [Deltaproteobacteria bacterium]